MQFVLLKNKQHISINYDIYIYIYIQLNGFTKNNLKCITLLHEY